MKRMRCSHKIINLYNNISSIETPLHYQMNRVYFDILQENTSVNFKQLKGLEDVKPNQNPYCIEKFPIYPLSINMYLENPPFNKFTIIFSKDFCPSRGFLYGSENGQSYTKFHELTNLNDREDQQYTKIFKQKIFFQYIKIVLEEPLKNKINLCKQIKIRGFEFSQITFYQTRFVCSLISKLTYHPTLFRLLQIIEYKNILLKQYSNKLCQKYEKRMEQLVRLIDSKKINVTSPEQGVVKKWSQQADYLQKQPIHFENFIEYPDPVQTKKDINKLQKQIQEFAVDRISKIKPHVAHYFEKFQYIEIKQSYLRELSSPESQDHNSALINFWSDVKKLNTFTSETQQAILMFYNFYLEFIQSNLKISAIKILILFNQNNPNPKNPTLNQAYDRLLHNTLKFIHQKEDEQLYNMSLRYCYILFDRINNQTFLSQLLNGHKSYTLAQKIQILQILQKITFRNVQVVNKRQIIIFLTDILFVNEITLTQKNRAYNIAAYLASIYGKETILKDFEKLNAMLIMTMERNIDNKLNKISKPQNNQEQTHNCEFCGIYNNKFKDENIYDLHLAKECKFITTCNYCYQNIQIPELFKHYIQQCQSKHEFKHCDNCFEVIMIKDEQTHNQTCQKKLSSKCPLCYEKVENKLKLKEHLLIKGCPNNFR